MEHSLLLLRRSQIKPSKSPPKNRQYGPRSTQEPARLSRPPLRIQRGSPPRLCLGSKFELTPLFLNDISSEGPLNIHNTFGSGENMEKLNMQESKSMGAISRRSTRIFMEEQLTLESGNPLAYESRCPSREEMEKENNQRDMSTSTSGDISQVPRVNLGKDLCNIFPTTADAIGKQVVKSLQVAQEASTKAKGNGKPLNFGVVLPGNIYRSSLPMKQNWEYLESLRLKTILSLVKKDFTADFQTFVKKNSISHQVIDMPGTKKVAIPEDLMSSIMKIALDRKNYPLLIHCNHGKHRTGCAIAVIRHVTGWNTEAILEEYKGFAAPKVRDCDVDYITKYQVATLEGLFTGKKIRQSVSVLTSDRMAKLFMITVVVLSLWVTTLLFW